MKNYVIAKDERGYDCRWKIGDVEVFKIIEYRLVIPFSQEFFTDIMVGVKYEDFKIPEWMIPHYTDAPKFATLPITSFLIKLNGKNILIDTGGNYESNYFENLKVAGCAPEDIDYVMFTHLHADHTARNVKPGPWYSVFEPTFPNARYLFNKDEYDFFTELQYDPSKRRNNPNYDHVWPYRAYILPLVDTVGARSGESPSAEASQSQVDFIDESFTMDGVLSVSHFPGHTRGELGYWINSKGDSMLICGDIVTQPYQLEYLSVVGAHEYSPKLTTETRKKLLNKLAGTDTYFICSHFVNGGYVIKSNDGYRLIPDEIATKNNRQ
jgi:glyoxylase-like metal-dependent hydrolase (beta-lactamase superfamily II)